ncbi:MAG: Rne/Rng family ribonuclease [Candidatus Kinetoplastibacterium crithidii]|nr:Rne/Rng family ribonuclease [Candidatus Kinetoplastibacterium crithidii]
MEYNSKQYEDILISTTCFETRVAILENSIIQELHIEHNMQRNIVGNIFIGKVIRVLPGLQSAFIDIGLDKAAFIHISDFRENRHENMMTPSIEKFIFPGETILVQVIKDQIGTKGARVSTQISIAGRILVYLPFDNCLGVSQKIKLETDREKIKTRVQSLINYNRGGFIIRTQAEEATDEEISTDLKYLNKLWENIIETAKSNRSPSLIYKDLDLPHKTLRDMVTQKTRAINIDSYHVAKNLLNWAKIFNPSITEKIHHYDKERSIFEAANIDQEINTALSKKVELKSGGYLIIEETEALTSIDVNTGGFVGGKNFKDTIFRTNLEATQAIARQLRLRNLGGIIIVDFIDMDDQDHKNAVLKELQKSISKDRTKITLSEFSQLGLVEMTRKRTRESLTNQLCEPCNICQSRGMIKTSRTICYEILREVVKESKQFNPKEFRIIASQKIVDMFLEESQYLTIIEDQIKKPISLIVENGYYQEQYDIALL